MSTDADFTYFCKKFFKLFKYILYDHFVYVKSVLTVPKKNSSQCFHKTYIIQLKSVHSKMHLNRFQTKKINFVNLK